MLRTVELEGGEGKPVAVMVSPDGRLVYAANGLSDTISIVDTRTRREVASVKVGKRPWGVAVH